MTDKLVVEGLYKIFGPNPREGLRLLDEGMGKDEIFRRTGNTVGVNDANLTIREGEVFVVMGLSGSGKSTLVRMLNRLIEPTSGHIYLDGKDIVAMSRKEIIRLRRREMTMVFQSFALLPHRTVLGNVGFGLEVAGVPRKKQEKAAMDALEAVGLGANANSYPDELSGGMQQRVGLARALAVNPSILLMDEAFSALDPLIRTEMQDELLQLQREQTRTVVFISHDLDEAMRIGDRLAIMEDGAVVQIGTPEEIVSRPANDYVRSFFYGVDVSQVYTAGDICDRHQVTLIQRPGVSVRSALDRMRRHGSQIAVVVDGDQRFQGLVTAESLVRHVDRANGEGGGYAGAFVDGVETVDADTPVSEVLGVSAESRWPLIVLTADGRYRGTVSRSTLLLTLDRSRSEEGVTDQEGSATVQGGGSG